MTLHCLILIVRTYYLALKSSTYLKMLSLVDILKQKKYFFFFDLDASPEVQIDVKPNNQTDVETEQEAQHETPSLSSGDKLYLSPLTLLHGLLAFCH